VIVFGNALKKQIRVFEVPLPRNAQKRTKKYVFSGFI
jgi:hypothetical protein